MLFRSRLGQVRGAAGVGIAETLDDVGVLYRLVARDPGLDVVRSLCEGWASSIEAAPMQAACIDPESGLPTLEYLVVRLGETYGAASKHAHHAFVTHCLVLVDVATSDLPPWRRMARSAAMGRALTAALAPGHPMAALGGGAFAILVARDWDLGETVRHMRDQVNEHAEALPSRTWYVSRRGSGSSRCPRPTTAPSTCSATSGDRRTTDSASPHQPRDRKSVV